MEILSYKNPIVRKKSAEIEEITPEIKRLALDMLETMQKEKGLGLAAPQVGQLKRVIAVHLPEGEPRDGKIKLAPCILVNPSIIKKSKTTQIDEEGCLCAPGVFLKIKRAKSIEATAQDLEGNRLQIKVSGLPARIIQHEIDHLEGILFFDRLPFWQKINLDKKLKRQ
jgi:peptide deformylase